ncbi:MAG: Cps2E [Phycisphaerales bacterium]|nr:Cps2E [Phycisphaerales bacterium]
MSQPIQPQSDGPRPETGTGFTSHRRLHEMYFPKHLAAVIRRERARADRQKSRFCLVMFRLVPAGGRISMLRLTRLVMNEVRTTDEVGLYDRHTVCAVLPDTAPSGASILIRRTRELCYQRGMTVEPVLYTYPGQWFDGDENGQGPRPLPVEKPNNGETLRIADDASTHVLDADPLPMEDLLSRRPSAVKRALDVAIAGTALLVASPVIAAIAALIKFSDHGPIIFRQNRSGLGGRPFQIYKFRTMHVGADKMKAKLREHSEQDGPAFKLTNDPRITAIGKFLRKTSLDELPQLFNVLKGDMSLVGPRPLPIDEQNACDPWHRARLDVMPGLTCVWQVKGRSRVSFDDWMRMDLSYTKNYQVTQDIKLIFQTIPAVLLRRGAK